MRNIGTYSSNLFKVADVTAHQEGCRSHEKVQHPSGQDRDVWLLPRQGLKKARDNMLKGTSERGRYNRIQCKTLTCR